MKVLIEDNARLLRYAGLGRPLYKKRPLLSFHLTSLSNFNLGETCIIRKHGSQLTYKCRSNGYIVAVYTMRVYHKSGTGCVRSHRL